MTSKSFGNKVKLNNRQEYEQVHGRVMLSSPVGAEDPNVISLSPVSGGGLLVKDPDTDLWRYVDFVAQNNITGDRSNCYLNNVSGQTLANNTFYYIGVKFVAGVPVINFTTGGQNKTADTFVDVPVIGGVMDAYTSLVGMCYTLNNSFIFDSASLPRCVVSNLFPTSNQFGIKSQDLARATASTSWVKLSTDFDAHIVTNSVRMFLALTSGYVANDTAGQATRIKLAIVDAAGAVIANGSVSGGTSSGINYEVGVCSVFSQPLAQGYYRVEIWAQVTGGTGTFTGNTTVLLLSA